MRAVLALLLAASLASASPLWDYVHTPDSHYSYFDTGVRLGGSGYGWTGYLLNMTSQQWLDPTRVSRSIWTHQLVVIVPDKLKFNDTAGMYVTGNGNNNPGVPSATDEDILVASILAVSNGIVTSTLFQIPNAPIVFADDPSQEGRSEDALVAWTWKMYVDGGDPNVIAYFPMVKASVRAMDTVQDFTAKMFGMNITKHCVAGASKRGWDTWLTGAVDTRVIAIAPIVMDMLNFTANVRHMYRSYGGWTFAFQDYYNVNMTLWLGTNASAVAALATVIDPLVYKENLTMPKLIIDATGDEFFMPDDDWYWWGELSGETYRLIIANAEHSEATGLLTLLPGAIAFFESVLTGTPRPQFDWDLDLNTGAIVVVTKQKPDRMILRFATTYDDVRRDFRLIKGNTANDPCEFIPVKVFGNACVNPVLWGYEDLAPTSVSNGVYTYVLTQPLPPQGFWRGFLGELRYPGPNGMEFIFTTQVSIIPNTYPFPDCKGPACKGTLV